VYYNTVLGKQAVTHIEQNGFNMQLIEMLGEYKPTLIDSELLCDIMQEDEGQAKAA
jgi:hypothetical protein